MSLITVSSRAKHTNHFNVINIYHRNRIGERQRSTKMQITEWLIYSIVVLLSLRLQHVYSSLRHTHHSLMNVCSCSLSLILSRLSLPCGHRIVYKGSPSGDLSIWNSLRAVTTFQTLNISRSSLYTLKVFSFNILFILGEVYAFCYPSRWNSTRRFVVIFLQI